MSQSPRHDSTGKPLRVLFVEDNAQDIKLISHSLVKAGFALAFDSVDLPEALENQLRQAAYDVVICDVNLPGWTAMEALDVVRDLGKDVPLIVVSGSLVDEAAVECIKRGATDYILKDRMARLPAAIDGALSDKASRDRRRRDEIALREGAKQYRVLFDSNPHPMWVFDIETLAFLAVNDTAVTLYGYSREEFLRMTVREIRPPEEVDKFLVHLGATATVISALGNGGTFKHRTKNGTLLDLEVAGNPIVFQGRAARLVLANDVTERNNLQAQLGQSQKMESLGQLAGGVAHDINNLMGVVLGYGELILEQLHDTERVRQGIENILIAGERVVRVVRQLLAFSRKQVRQPKAVNLNELLKGMEDMLRRLIGEDIELSMATDPNLWTTKVDTGQIEQVVMNLAVNARDAMPAGGRLAIGTCNAELHDEDSRRRAGVPDGDYVLLTVTDTGCGMNNATQARIFEPFFTTKGPDQGTGLGLATAYGIVQQSQGSICVHSEVGQGTTFRIYLPRVEAPASPIAARQRTAMPGGTETVLLVEDAEPLRRVAHQFLLLAGYTVLPAEDGLAALRMAREHPQRIAIMVTDVVMPGMSGLQLARELSTVRQEMKVLYMSGYTDDAIGRHGLLEEDIALLEKPFTRAAFLRKIRETLDA